jgi:riboflavin transporter FmnP
MFHVMPFRVLPWLTWGMLKILEVDIPVLNGQLVTDFKLE